LALQKTGAAGKPLTELDNLILDVIGRESAYVKGIANKSAPPSFSNAVSNHDSTLASTSHALNVSALSHLETDTFLNETGTSYVAFENGASGNQIYPKKLI